MQFLHPICNGMFLKIAKDAKVVITEREIRGIWSFLQCLVSQVGKPLKCQTDMVVNFVSDVLIRFQKAYLDIDNDRPTEIYHNLLLVQFWKVFESFVVIQSVSRSFTSVIKDAILITSHYLIK